MNRTMYNMDMGTRGGLLAFLAAMILGAGCASPDETAAEVDEDQASTTTASAGEPATSPGGSEPKADREENGTPPSDEGDSAGADRDTSGDTDTASSETGAGGTAGGVPAEGGLANATARTTTEASPKAETEKTVTVKVLSDGWALLPLLRTKVTAEDEGKHLVEVFSRAPGPDWEIQLRPRKPSTSKRNLWKEYEIVGKPPENAKETAAPVERKAAIHAEFPEDTASVIIYGTDRRGEEVSLIEPVP